jgi:hypothetical protein
LIEGVEGIETATADGTLALLQLACIRGPSRYSFLRKMKARPATGFVLGTPPGTAVITYAQIR